jgi:nucleotide-binding universal stress UspA family protein
MSYPLNSEPILVAMDFSPYSTAALKQAVWLARKTGAPIVLTHSIPDFSKSVHWGPYEREVNQRELHDRSETAMRRVIVDLNAMDLDVTFRPRAMVWCLQELAARENLNSSLSAARRNG